MNHYVPILKKTNLFSGMNEAEIESIIPCLTVQLKKYKKGEYIIRNGERIYSLGMVLSGLALVEKDDFWGNRTILQEIKPGMTFAESYACLAQMPIETSVVANTETEIIFFNMKKLLTVCTSACSHHSRLIQNLLETISKKNVTLTKKIEYITQKTIRDRLLLYLSTESQKAGSTSFTIPFNRQELADYLSVDRSALSNEISKLQKEGILTCKKNSFNLN